jgi:hypothetical protein
MGPMALYLGSQVTRVILDLLISSSFPHSFLFPNWSGKWLDKTGIAVHVSTQLA